MLRKLIYSISFLLIVAVSSVLYSHTVHAEIAFTVNSEYKQGVDNAVGALALRKCVTESYYKPYPVRDVNDGFPWFRDGGSSTAGPLSGTNDKGMIECTALNNMSKSILNNLGFPGTSYVGIYCAMGILKNEDGSSCKDNPPSDSGSVYVNSILGQKLEEKAGFGDDRKYVAYISALNKYCALDGGREGNRSDMRTDDVWVDVVQNDGSKKGFIYSTSQKKKEVYLVGIGPSGSTSNRDDSKITCSDLAELVNSLADAFAAHAGEAGVKNDGSDNAGSGSSENGDSDAPTCSSDIGVVGWIVCPVTTFLAGLNDGLFAIVKSFLTVDSRLLTDGSTSAMWGSGSSPLARDL